MSEHPLSVVRQCRLLEVPRSSFYYRPAPVSAEDLDLMRRIDAIHLDYPFLGSRRVQDELGRAGLRVNRKKIRRLMRAMGIAALYPKPRTSTPASGHRIYPYLLRDVAVTRPNQVWASDITYIPMAHGFMYLVAVLDWFSRRVLSWELSNTMDVAFCVAALEEALDRSAPRTSSTAIRVRSTPRRRSPVFWSRTGWRSAWMAGGGSWTTSSSSVCGAA